MSTETTPEVVEADADTEQAPRRRGPRLPTHLPLATVLVGGVTLLIILAVGSVLVLTLLGARDNTFSLLGQRAAISLDLLEERLAGQLGPVEEAATELGAQFADGRLNLGERRQRAFDTFVGVFAALPQVSAVLFVPVEGEALRTTTREGLVIEVPASPQLLKRQRRVLQNAYQQPAPEWSAPFYVLNINRAAVTRLVPVRRGDDFVGVVAVTITLDTIVQFLGDLQNNDNLSAFILYDRDFVLAHPRLLDSDFRPSSNFEDNPLPSVNDVSEPAFRLLESGGLRADQLLQNAPTITDARRDDDFIIITRDINRYGALPWTIGLKVRVADVSGEVRRLQSMAIAGLVILLIAAGTGFLFARMLTRKIVLLAGAAEMLSSLDIAHVPPVPDSFVNELSHAARAFNTMVGALRWFETYVPKALVLRLMHEPDAVAQSSEREVTVLFTDISGFSTMAEEMSAQQTAAMLNNHFELLASCIEAEGGTVDKFMGDGLMAFWGAPETVDDHAARALRAGTAIQEAIVADNFQRTSTDRRPISLRVGIHTGPAVVGNIGSKNRINYTVVGDTVNVASRLEALAKDFEIRDQCVVLISKETRDRGEPHLGDASGITFSEIGDHRVRGRAQKLTVYRLYAADA